jgi:phthalate 4,5-dioxygenase
VGELLRRYWQPVALLDEFDSRFDPAMATRPVKAVRLLGQDLVLFRDANGQFGLLDRDCPHRGADLAFGRNEGDGLRCPFHGWKFDLSGQCTETPAEPAGSTCANASASAATRFRPAPASVRLAWAGSVDSPALPALDCFEAPESHSFCLQGPVALQLATGLRGRHRPGPRVLPAPLLQ